MNDLRVHRLSVLMVAAAAALTTACSSASDATDPAARAPATLEAVTPTNLTGTVGTEVTPAPAVLVKDRNGNPLQGVLVTFTGIVGGGYLANTPRHTDVQGIATAGSWTLGTRAGTNSVTAAVSGLAPVVFSVAAAAKPFSTITLVGGGYQIGRPDSPLLSPLSVKVTDAFGNPARDVSVSFSPRSGDGRIDGATALTDSSGIAASGAWTLGPATGLQQVVARAGDRELVFEALAVAGGCKTTCPATRIAFERAGRVMVVSEDGGNPTDIGDGKTPSWSPDGMRLVFERSGRLWLMELSTGGITALTKGAYADSHPSWSPDGSRVAFFRWWDGPDQSYLAVINVADRSERVLSMWWPVQGRTTWSPDGSRIAFTCEGPSPRWESDICIVPASGDEGYFSTGNRGPTKVMVDIWINVDPAWSPDGKWIAFTTNRGSMRPHIALIQPEGDTFWTLVPGHHAAWSHDGSRIVFAGNADAPGLHVVNSDGSGLRRITDHPGDTAPSWQP